MTHINNERNLTALVERGGVYYNVPGTCPKDLIAGVIGLMPPVKTVDQGELLRQIMEREAIVSTGVGHGIALPHPRNPVLEGSDEEPLVAIAFPVTPVNWNTHDGSKVHTVFLIVSSSAKQHLDTLSRINFLCQKEKFRGLIEARVSKKEIIAAIKEAEDSWVNK